MSSHIGLGHSTLPFPNGLSLESGAEVGRLFIPSNISHLVYYAAGSLLGYRQGERIRGVGGQH